MSRSIDEILQEDYFPLDKVNDEFLNRFNIESIVDVLRGKDNFPVLVDEAKSNAERQKIRDKLISFFEFFDVDNTGCINAVHLKKFLVDSLNIMDAKDFEKIFFKAEIEGAGYINYVSFAYKVIPEKEDEDY